MGNIKRGLFSKTLILNTFGKICLYQHHSIFNIVEIKILDLHDDHIDPSPGFSYG
jgi:hypothetical protein